MWILIVQIVMDVPLIEGHDGQLPRALTNGTPYTTADMNYVLRGQPPYDSVGRYSSELVSAVKSCLHYHPVNRPSLDYLSGAIAQNIAAPPTNNAPGPLKLAIADNQADFRVGQTWNGQDPPENLDYFDMTPPSEDVREYLEEERSPEGSGGF
jgi:hypothetical protein